MCGEKREVFYHNTPHFGTFSLFTDTFIIIGIRVILDAKKIMQQMV
jgi:hypothetical protein